MKIRILSLMLATLALGVAWQNAAGQHLLKHHHAGPPACEPGYKIVEEVVLQDVERFVCKMVPEFKKKWVYSTIDDAYCIQNTRHGECAECSGPYCRKRLVKKQIDEPCPTMKCVTEKILEKVAVTVYRKVPIDTPSNIETILVKPIPVQPGKK